MLNLKLNLFDGEGAAAGAPTANTGEINTENNTVKTSSAAGEKRANKNPLANVVYGKQEEKEHQVAAGAKEAETQVTANTDRRTEFDKLINGDYKQEFDKKVQNLLNLRFKETKTLQEQLEKSKPILDMLSAKYGAKDIESLAKSVEEDESFYAEEAFKRNMSVEELKRVKKLERENSFLHEQLSQETENTAKQRQIAQWAEQGEKLMEIYPDFDLKSEFGNKEFGKLLLNGIDVRTAYEVIHNDEIRTSLVQTAVQKAKQATVDNIKARENRPTENASGNNSAVITKTNVKNLTKEDRQEILRRVSRGEKISF